MKRSLRFFGGSRTQSHTPTAHSRPGTPETKKAARQPYSSAISGSSHGARLWPSSAAKKFCMTPELTPRRCGDDSSAMIARHTGRNGPSTAAHQRARDQQHLERLRESRQEGARGEDDEEGEQERLAAASRVRPPRDDVGAERPHDREHRVDERGLRVGERQNSFDM